jgi:hypothetical protein
MKKALASISVVIYFAMTCGVIVNLHYCMGRVQSFEFYGTEKKVCDVCGMSLKNTHGCCKEEVKILKIQDDQNKAHASYSIKSIDVPAIIPSDFIVASIYNPETTTYFDDHSPPLLTKQDTYLQNCVFRI